MPVQTLTDSNFDATAISANGPVLVDFWGDGCVPCKRLAPIVDAVAGDYAGRVTVGTLNVHDHPDAAIRFQIRSIPTLLLFTESQQLKADPERLHSAS